jgi:uncharacterized protein
MRKFLRLTSGEGKIKSVIKEQRAWLKTRSKCGDTACLKKIYSERVTELVSRGTIKKLAHKISSVSLSSVVLAAQALASLGQSKGY